MHRGPHGENACVVRGVPALNSEKPSPALQLKAELKKKFFFFETRDVQTEWKGLLRPVLARLTQVMSPECPSGFRCDVLEFRYQ